MNQRQLLASQLRSLADSLEGDTQAQIKTQRYTELTVPGDPTKRTGMVKLSVEVFLPSVKTAENQP